jgi:hypothetical protein
LRKQKTPWVETRRDHKHRAMPRFDIVVACDLGWRLSPLSSWRERLVHRLSTVASCEDRRKLSQVAPFAVKLMLPRVRVLQFLLIIVLVQVEFGFIHLEVDVAAQKAFS